MPLALASGVGAEGNRSIGTGAVGGLLIGTVFGVFVIPILYIFFQWLQEKIVGPRQVEPVTEASTDSGVEPRNISANGTHAVIVNEEE